MLTNSHENLMLFEGEPSCVVHVLLEHGKRNSYSSAAMRVKLTGNDVPGANLRAPFEDHTVLALNGGSCVNGSVLLVPGRSHS